MRHQVDGTVVRATVPLGGACGSGRCPYRQGGTITVTYDPEHAPAPSFPTGTRR